MKHKGYRPVFIVGSPRSGTTWLYHLLLSASQFAIYRSESQVYSRFAPAINGMLSSVKRRPFIDSWIETEFFVRSGLVASEFIESFSNCKPTPGCFLRTLMESICEQQGATRWAECTPDHALYMDKIKDDFPDACFIHLVRDGRDVTLSLAKKRFISSIPQQRNGRDISAAVYWAWITRKAAASADRYPRDVFTIHYEDLVRDTRSVLDDVSEFIQAPIDFKVVQENAIGSIRNPNSSFSNQQGHAPVGGSRWHGEDKDWLRLVEGLIGDQLRHFGYDPMIDDSSLTLLNQLQKLALEARFEVANSCRSLGIALPQPLEQISEMSQSKQAPDPTIRPGENIDLIRSVVAGKKTLRDAY